MGKCRADIQREYRERKKAKLGDEYNRKERERVRRYYVPAAELSNKKRKERNEKAKLKNRRSRARRKERLERLQVRESCDDGPSDSGYDSIKDATAPRNLIVRLPAITVAARANGAKRVNARALARAHKSISSLEMQKAKLERRLKTKSKQIERMRKRLQMNSSIREKNPNETREKEAVTTPKRKTIQEVASLNLTPRRKKFVRKKLLLTNVLLDEVKSAKAKSSRKKSVVIRNVVAGKISRKYRCMKMISSGTGLSRRTLIKCQSKSLLLPKEVRKSVAKEHVDKVEEFLSREDNCRVQPGKSDVKKGKQTKVLTDYMKNLWQKFSAENPGLKMSLSTFCRLRPRHILLARFISRNACQCLRHQNMALKLQAMRKIGMKLSENPENICTHKDNLEELFDQVDGCITTLKYRMWKKVETDNKMKKTMVVETEVSLQDFISLVKKEVGEFCDHVSRLRTQYNQLKINKETLPENQVIVQMDFAENYTCRALDEVQTAYWSLTSVTLHPTVIYYRENDVLKHQSYVVVSNTLVHSASTVAAFMDAILPEIRKVQPDLEHVHYWTDSPSSQYRNRFMFHTLANHKELYGCDAQWNYFEAGHGKSACDGLGGTTKRMADEAARQGNALIQNAEDFYKWACQSTMKDVKFLFVDKKECEQKQARFSALVIKPVRNTMKLHAIKIDPKENVIRIKETSCYCDLCCKGNFCESWQKEKYIFDFPGKTSKKIKQNSTQHVSEEKQDEDLEMHEAAIEESVDTRESLEKADHPEILDPAENGPAIFETLKVNDYVAARYDGKVYIGKVLELDEADRDCKITFMEKAKELFRWPKREDILWIDEDNILAKIQEPEQTGKSKRLFKISEADKSFIRV